MNLTVTSKKILLDAIRWYVGEEAAAVGKDESDQGLSEAVYQFRRRVDDVLSAWGELWTGEEPTPRTADVLAAVLRSYREDGVAATVPGTVAEREDLDGVLKEFDRQSASLGAEKRWSRGRTLPIRMVKKSP